MKLGIMQPYIFPYLGYWQLLNAVDEYILLDDVTFIKQGYINRNSMLAQGKATPFNIQVKDISSNKLISEHKMNDDPRWRKKLIKSIRQNYSKAPQFSEVMPMLENCILDNTSNLNKFLCNAILRVAEYIGINTKIHLSSKLNLAETQSGQDRIISICKELGAREYYNAIGGKALYRAEAFCEAGVDLFFVDSQIVEYKQHEHAFVPNLSIIDLLMFNDLSAVDKHLGSFNLVSND